MISFTEIDRNNNSNYLRLLSAIAKLSRLFSNREVPYIEYRIVENVFCRSFNATNLSRSDTAFDANYNSVGVGIKTFISSGELKAEKIAEFNLLSRDLRKLKDKDLALELARLRNERIDFAQRLYGLQDSLYHIVARRKKQLLIFETDYDKININGIKVRKSNDTVLQFEDGNNEYRFNYSKSTLYRVFEIPENAFSVSVSILEDPYALLLDLFKDELTDALTKVVDNEFVILPLYGTKKGRKFVFEKSGLNQWNASGRKRDYGEVYIPIPADIHHHHKGFFPDRDVVFRLQIPTGDIFEAKVCQDNSKALMTNPNNALSNWLLRNVLSLKEGEILKIEKLIELGFDSVRVEKISEGFYKIDKAKINSYEDFINKDTFDTENE